jgi:O-methyltransferase
MRRIKKKVRSVIRSFGFDLVPSYLCPEAHKLVDFRREAGFLQIAGEIKGHRRTRLDYNRLFVLWQAVHNTFRFGHAVAEIGSYKGGSARFIASAFAQKGQYPLIHVFDTFEGHPDFITPTLDGPHTKGDFSDTSYEAVKEYLSSFRNIQIHPGAFEDTCAEVTDATFSLVHIDVDIYRSTVHCLEFFWPRLCDGGVIVADDYGFVTCQGVKQAVDAFVNQVSPCQTWYMQTGQFVIQKY